MAKVLILGAQGRIGLAVTEAFHDAGWCVTAQSRRDEAVFPPDVARIRCDALDAAGLTRAASGADVVVNALNAPYTEWARLAKPLAANALAAAAAGGALLMLPGNIYNFGRLLPPRLDQDTPEIPNTSKAKIRIEMEKELRDAAARGVNSVVVRSGDFFGGKGRGSWFDMVVVKSLDGNRMVYPGPTDRLHAWAYLPDLARTFVRIAENREKIRGFQRYHFGGHAVTGAELHQAMERVTGRTLRLGSMPWSLVGMASPFSPMMKSIFEMRYMWRRPHALEDAPLRRLLGNIPHTPLEEALFSTLTGLGCSVAQPGRL